MQVYYKWMQGTIYRSLPLDPADAFTSLAFLSVPFWSAPDASLSHSFLAIFPLLHTSGSCLFTPTTLSIFAPGDPTPVLVGSKRAPLSGGPI